MINYLCISTYSISPEKEKNSVISLFEAFNEILATFTVLTCKRLPKISKWDEIDSATLARWRR
jgi:hypothetical protein